ncbi:MAG TPA: 1-deoxy-D-xylulose-5-phosphate reductoisomerase [Syntrophorhabdaceae bacterium]|nr:1-deoxy-D-xylulose-5-phosphate reductoisomerase [Syntrophorhabdaceae bacterium]
MKKKIIILGSTGSIGKSALEVIERETEHLEVLGLACKDSVELLNKQILKHKPQHVCIYEESRSNTVISNESRLLTGMEGMKEMMSMDFDIVLNALPGSIGLEPTIAALENGKTVALANKESLVMAGRIITKLLNGNRQRLIPVDSEHSAVHQLLQAVPRNELKTLIITASGGPFRNTGKDDLANITPEQALRHPTWNMGRKITLDSATLMNKGLEVIEAKWLFDVKASDIKVLVHPESIIHGLIELTDNSVMAYMAYPDMKIPIGYALNGSQRSPVGVKPLKLDEIQSLSFYPPDTDRFPSLKLAYDALASGDSALITLNTANEIACDAFIAGRIRFSDIPTIVKMALDAHTEQPVVENVDELWDIYYNARACTESILKKRT